MQKARSSVPPNAISAPFKANYLTNPPAVSVDVGTPAPAFRLLASTGGEIGLADYRDRANVVLFFVRAYN